MQWLKINDKKEIVDHICGKIMPDSPYNVPVTAFNGAVGMTLDWLDMDKGGIVLPADELAEKGLIIDKRGSWYHKINKIQIEITEYGIDPGEEYTKVAPEADNYFQEWSEEKQAWVENAEEKKKAELRNNIINKKNEIASGDYRVIKAYEAGVLLDELYPGETDKRNLLRAEINELETELQEMEE